MANVVGWRVRGSLLFLPPEIVRSTNGNCGGLAAVHTAERRWVLNSH